MANVKCTYCNNINYFPYPVLKSNCIECGKIISIKSQKIPFENNSSNSEELYFGKILGLKGKVSINQIHKAYKNKIKEYHPDKAVSEIHHSRKRIDPYRG